MCLALIPAMLYLNFRSMRYWGMLCVLLLWTTRAEAASVTLAWDPSPDPGVAGYTVGYGTQPGQYGILLDAGLNTTFTINSLPDGTYYFAVRAYTSDGLSSGFSNEVVATVTSGGTTTPPPTSPTTSPTSSCTTPDPFISMGGGTCYNGGWLPPGMPIPSGSTEPAPQPAPAPAPAPSTGCSTPDPFATLGGGTCYNGGWLPPGMPVPGGSPAPAPSPTPTTPPPPPPSSVGTCSTPDPFAALGGGTCYNGGWLPPGMPVPGGSPAPAPSPTTPPPPPPTNSGSCSTPDPFAALGGGTCYNGGWLPPGMPVPNGGSSTPAPAPAPTPESPTGVQLACVTADPFLALGGGTCHNGAWLPPGMEITVNGTLRVLSVEDGLWLIEGEDGTVYTSSSEVPAEMLIEGATVTITALTLPSTLGTDGAAVVELIDIEIH